MRETRTEQRSIADVENVTYSLASASLLEEFARLQLRAYGFPNAGSRGGRQPLHDPALNAGSFYIRQDGRTVSYAAVVTNQIRCGGQCFTASGLSCVATDPDFQRQGLGQRVVAATTDHIEGSCADIGIFTCAPHLARFYQDAGSWPVQPGVVLIGSRHLDAITSETINVVVLMRLFSPRAREASASLRHGTIDLGLPVGQFW